MMNFESAMSKALEAINKMPEGEHKKRVTEILNKLPKSGPNWYYENAAVGPSVPLDKANENILREYFEKEAREMYGDNMDLINKHIRDSMEGIKGNDTFTYKVIDGGKEFSVTITEQGNITINSIISDRDPKDTAHVYQQQHKLNINHDRNNVYDIRETKRTCEKDENKNDIQKESDVWQVIKNGTLTNVYSSNTTLVNDKVVEQTKSNVSKEQGSNTVKIDVDMNGKEEHETVKVNRDITLEDAAKVQNKALNAEGNEPKPEKTSKKTAAML